MVTTPHSVVRAPGLNENAFSVISASGSHGSPQLYVVKERDQIRCECDMYRATNICSHSVAVAEMNGWLEKFLVWLKTKGKEPDLSSFLRTSLPKGAGKKPGQKKQNTRIPKIPIQQTVERTSARLSSSLDFAGFTHVWQNNHPFFFVFVTKQSKKCESCLLEFPQVVKIAPFDLALVHRERYMYPTTDEEGNKVWVPTRARERNAYYHVDATCVKQRHPHFDSSSMISVDDEVRRKLKDVHWKLLKDGLGYQPVAFEL